MKEQRRAVVAPQCDEPPADLSKTLARRGAYRRGAA